MSVGTSGAIQQPPASAGFFGQGVKYPPTLDTATGRLKLSWGADLVEQAIMSICQTQSHERPMLPGYGAAQATFEPTDLLRYKLFIEQSVVNFEPRVKSVNATADLVSPGEVFVRVTYQLAGDANPRTLTATVFQGPASTGASG